MITLKDFMEVVDFKITEGSDYCWDCFGPNAYTLTSWNGEHDGHSLSITFDTKFHTVYQVEAFDYQNNRAYRLMHPDCVEDYQNEADMRQVDPDEAWDGVKFVDLETEEDWLKKAQAIVVGEDYDTRVDIPLRLDDDHLFELMKQAHERDMTFNEFVEQALKDFIEEHRHLLDRPEIQSPPFPATNFTQEEAREAVRKAQKKLKKKDRG